jgi:hypothetical protein
LLSPLFFNLTGVKNSVTANLKKNNKNIENAGGSGFAGYCP